MRCLTGRFLASILSMFLGGCASAQTVGGGSAVLGPLLDIHWMQRGAFAAFCPLDPETGERQALGCWSVGLAQILYYHRLLPSGSVSYGTGGSFPGADFDAERVELSRVLSELSPSSSEIDPEGARQTALYLWYAALATGKDFGTDGYIDGSDGRRRRIEEHYRVETERMNFPDAGAAEVEDFIRAELGAGRPLLLYVEGEDSGHALVIDGAAGSGKSFKVHLNFGWAGESDGWYPFWKPILDFDRPDRWVLAIRPLSGY